MPMLLICLLENVIPLPAAIRVLILVKLPGPQPIAKIDISWKPMEFVIKNLLIVGIKISDNSFLNGVEKLLTKLLFFKRQRDKYNELVSIARIMIFIFSKLKIFVLIFKY